MCFSLVYCFRPFIFLVSLLPFVPLSCASLFLLPYLSSFLSFFLFLILDIPCLLRPFANFSIPLLICEVLFIPSSLCMGFLHQRPNSFCFPAQYQFTSLTAYSYRPLFISLLFLTLLGVVFSFSVVLRLVFRVRFLLPFVSHCYYSCLH